MKEFKETHHSVLYNSTSDLALYAAGWEQCSSDYAYGPICRSYHLIHFVIEGKGVLKIDDHLYELSAGDAFLIPAGKVSWYKADTHNPWKYAWISFLGASSSVYMDRLLSVSDERYILRHLQVEDYLNNITKIICISGPPISQFLMSNSILFKIMANLLEEIDYRESDSTVHDTVDEIKFYLDMNYPKKIQISQVASMFGLHPNYMSRIFKDKYGMSPKQYLMDQKLKKASRLLVTTDHPVSLISGSLGFEDPLAFSKLFKKKYTISPTDYRKIYITDQNQ